MMRPKKTRTATARFNLRIDPALRRKLREVAGRHDLTDSQFVRRLIREAVS